jgi:hypothetical protein
VKMNRTLAFLRYVALPLFAAAALWAQQPGTEIEMKWVVQQPGGKTGVKREEFSRQAKPGPGKEIRVLMEANRECVVSFAGFTRDGQLVYGSPETVVLPANIVKELPVSKKWTFDGHEQLFEIDAVIAYPAAADYKTYAALVARMNQPGIPAEVWQAQAGALREWIDGHLRSKATAADYSVKENPAQIGGVIRGDLNGQVMTVPPQKTSVIRIRMQ